MPIALVVEGDADSAILQHLLRMHDLAVGPIRLMGGKGKLDQRLPAFMSAARIAPWLVLRDLDADADCAPDLVGKLAPDAPPGFRLQIAVRAVEAWLMADRERFATFFGVPIAVVPRDVESLEDPKREVVKLAARSRKRIIRSGVAPRADSSASVGPSYNAHMVQFIGTEWRPQVAAAKSPSLESLVRHLEHLRNARGDIG